MSEQIIQSKSITYIRKVFSLNKHTYPLAKIDIQKLAYSEETVEKRFSSGLFVLLSSTDSASGIAYKLVL